MAELEFNQTNPQEAAAAGQNQMAEPAAAVQQAQAMAQEEANPAQDQGLAQLPRSRWQLTRRRLRWMTRF